MLINWKDGIQNGNGNKTRETSIMPYSKGRTERLEWKYLKP